MGKKILVYPSFGELSPLKLSVDVEKIQHLLSLPKEEKLDKILKSISQWHSYFVSVERTGVKGIGLALAVEPENGEFVTYPFAYGSRKVQYLAMITFAILTPPFTREKVEEAVEKLPSSVDELFQYWQKLTSKIQARLEEEPSL